MPLSACFLCDADLKTPGARAPASGVCGRVRVGAGHRQIHTGIQAK
jgi:hypothetical protein